MNPTLVQVQSVLTLNEGRVQGNHSDSAYWIKLKEIQKTELHPVIMQCPIVIPPAFYGIPIVVPEKSPLVTEMLNTYEEIHLSLIHI